MAGTAQETSWLARVDVFSRLTEEQRAMLAPVFRTRDVKAGDVVCKQGDAGDYLAVVSAGELSVRVVRGGHETEVRVLGLYEVFGEMSCLDPAPRSASVVARVDSQVRVLSRTMLNALHTNAPALFSGVVRGVAERVAERLEQTNASIEGLLVTKRSPTQPRQPSLAQLQSDMSRGRPHPGEVTLQAVGALKPFSARDLEVLKTVSVARAFAPGESICLQGEPARAAFVVVSGRVDVLRAVNQKIYQLARVEAGSLLGQLALLRDTRRSASLRAVDDVVVLGLARDRFDALLAAQSPLAIAFQEIVTIAGIQQLRMANALVGYLDGRETRREIPDIARRIVRKEVAETLEEADDVEAIAAAYLQTTLQNWDISPSELERVRVVKSEGVMSAAEIAARLKK
ncbi:cyclic nucleotide-binding domain-containing protein [Bradymonadaceae bacterium TMQ3]|nr:cyclic nucleotide-binding domain-containing protein [Bradymonadaceae bacterium TMQ3]TXC75686.1 cyclic nucleotide-binding domain-containing protein [Bradymonadales bacterium TMQ1]